MVGKKMSEGTASAPPGLLMLTLMLMPVQGVKTIGDGDDEDGNDEDVDDAIFIETRL